MNPETWNYTLTGGQTYRGQSSITLKSDGGFIGGMIAPVIHFPGLDWLKMEIPILFGQGAYGFYLIGDDRTTPDGQRVSTWEDQLLGGKDSSFGFVVEPGITLTFAPKSLPWLRLYVGVSYSINIGYHATLSDNYDGFTISAGTQLGIF